MNIERNEIQLKFCFRAADAVQSLSIKQRKCIFKNEMIGANAVNHNYNVYMYSARKSSCTDIFVNEVEMFASAYSFRTSKMFPNLSNYVNFYIVCSYRRVMSCLIRPSM